jgi:hypothetical protein
MSKSLRFTCRVEFIEGEPQRMTVAERDVLRARGPTGVRLSCQILCDDDMTVRAISRLAGSGRKDVGSQPAADMSRRRNGLNPNRRINDRGLRNTAVCSRHYSRQSSQTAF